MHPALRIALLASASLFLLPRSLVADTIHRDPAPIRNVTVIQETYRKVAYKIPGGGDIVNQLDRKRDRVRSVEYDEWPAGWEEGLAALASNRWMEALDGFLQVARANPDDYPQARQYGLFWAAETLRRWGEGGNAEALTRAVAAYRQLMSAEPETVFLARVHVGLGDCLLRTGNPDEARGGFEKVLADAYFSEGDRILAKLGKAGIREAGGDFQAALGEYTTILEEAKRSAPETVGTARVRVARCLLNLPDRVDEAQAEFDRVLAITDLPADSRASIRAGALNGRGECRWKKKEYEKAMGDFLRVVILYEEVASETRKAYPLAVQCMQSRARALETERKREEAGAWRRRAKDLDDEFRRKFG
jgi:tetratricopeptide (TPR) repeat protein